MGVDRGGGALQLRAAITVCLGRATCVCCICELYSFQQTAKGRYYPSKYHTLNKGTPNWNQIPYHMWNLTLTHGAVSQLFQLHDSLSVAHTNDRQRPFCSLCYILSQGSKDSRGGQNDIWFLNVVESHEHTFRVVFGTLNFLEIPFDSSGERRQARSPSYHLVCITSQSYTYTFQDGMQASLSLTRNS